MTEGQCIGRVIENGLERNKEQDNVEPCMLWNGLEFHYEWNEKLLRYFHIRHNGKEGDKLGDNC